MLNDKHNMSLRNADQPGPQANELEAEIET